MRDRWGRRGDGRTQHNMRGLVGGSSESVTDAFTTCSRIKRGEKRVARGRAADEEELLHMEGSTALGQLMRKCAIGSIDVDY